jgi:hypothetical protein
VCEGLGHLCVCYGRLFPGNSNDQQPVRNPLDINQTVGNTCSFDTDCGPGPLRQEAKRRHLRGVPAPIVAGEPWGVSLQAKPGVRLGLIAIALSGGPMLSDRLAQNAQRRKSLACTPEIGRIPVPGWTIDFTETGKARLGSTEHFATVTREGIWFCGRDICFAISRHTGRLSAVSKNATIEGSCTLDATTPKF